MHHLSGYLCTPFLVIFLHRYIILKSSKKYRKSIDIPPNWWYYIIIKGTEEIEMKKYNLSKIMKRAWELVKKSALTISSGLKKAWEEAKTMEQKLVELVGSPKQIAWAEDIRKNMISYLSALVRKYESEDRPARAEKRAKDMEILSNIKEASWFIENRSYAVYSTNYDSNDLSELMANRNEMNLYERIHKYAKEH
jgi:hypothetical protein